MQTALPPGSTIGILGGGQLGQMLSLAASRLGFECHIFDPNWGGPASKVSRFETNAPYEDVDAILEFAKACDVVTYEFENVPAPVNSVHELKRAAKRLGLPAVLKTRRFGYDGKGQVIIKSKAEIATAWAAMKDAPAILEQFIPFKREVSVIAARGSTGETAAYPLVENVHKNHILHTSNAPAENDTGNAQGW